MEPTQLHTEPPGNYFAAKSPCISSSADNAHVARSRQSGTRSSLHLDIKHATEIASYPELHSVEKRGKEISYWLVKCFSLSSGSMCSERGKCFVVTRQDDDSWW